MLDFELLVPPHIGVRHGQCAWRAWRCVLDGHACPSIGCCPWLLGIPGKCHRERSDPERCPVG
jgi:hypothetical protein